MVVMFVAMTTGSKVNAVRLDVTGKIEKSNSNVGTVSAMPSQQWKSRVNSTTSEGERLMLEALVESSRGGRRTVLQYIKMLSVIALPVAAVICLVSFTLHNSRVERATPFQFSWITLKIMISKSDRR